MNQITIFGVGLIGGSLALALRTAGFCNRIVGCSRNEAHLQRAIELGVIDSYSLQPTEAVVDADIVVLATPVGSFSAILGSIKDSLKPNVIITDAGSCKGSVVESANNVFGRVPPRFIPAHPIAGREKSGVEHADEKLYVGHKVIVTPEQNADSEALQTVIKMWQACGAEVKTLSAKQHDQVLAATSHLPHVIAYALVETVAKTDCVDEIFEFAAGGFRDSSRVASSDPTMWTDICLDNTNEILEVLKQFRGKLEKLEDLIESRSAPEIFKFLENCKTIRDQYFS